MKKVLALLLVVVMLVGVVACGPKDVEDDGKIANFPRSHTFTILPTAIRRSVSICRPHLLRQASP